MRPCGVTLLTALAQAQTVALMKADLFNITLLNGTVYRWTDFDFPIYYSPAAVTYYSVGQSLLQRSRLGVKNTVEVPELVIKLSALDTDFPDGSNIKTHLHNGMFDGATVYLDRVFMTAPGRGGLPTTVLGAIGTSGSGLGDFPGALFTGRMSSVKITAYGAEMTCKGANVLMNQYIPRNVYQLPCIHTFCDAGCTLAEATFTTSQTVGSGSGGPTVFFLPWASAPANPLIYTFGKITMTSGAANGQVRTVKQATSAGVYLQYPLYNLPAAGDTFNAVQGCNKNFNDGSGQSCNDRSNTQHFRGFPFIPVAETAF